MEQNVWIPLQIQIPVFQTRGIWKVLVMGSAVAIGAIAIGVSAMHVAIVTLRNVDTGLRMALASQAVGSRDSH
ncbi:hypothetical protein B2J88_12665 [Rhodococcus sp. SRB_17]|nr:hypothetical protein [Rhodococcus sp. SRB_17]